MDKVVSGEKVAQENAQREKPAQKDINTGHEVSTQGARAMFGLPVLLVFVGLVGIIIILVSVGA